MKRVAIIEDNSEINNLIRNILVYENYEPKQYFTGYEVMEKLEEVSSFDAILLDVMLPGSDGLSIFSELKKKFPLSEKKVLFLTAKSDSKTLSFFREHQCRYIIKPFDPYELLETLKTLF